MAVGSKVGEAYVELRAKMAKFESELKSAEMLTGKSVGRMQAKFQALAPTFRKVGIGMAVAGGAITAALGLAIKSSISFNKEMANIATLIPGATKRVIELKSAIRTMAVDVGKDTGDLAQGAYQVISAFGDTADTVAILKMSARAATAGVATTTDAINLLSAVTKGYGDTSKEAVQKASDLAFQTVTLGQTTFPELAASIGKAIPLAAELGIAEEELFTVMATGTGVTGKAAEVSTQLRGIFQSFLAPTADMTKLLEDMGYETGKAMLAEEGLHGALQSIIKAAEDSGMPLQKYISSIEGQTIALALTGAQSDTYIEKLAKMRDSVGLTDVAFKEQTEGVNKAGFAFQQAKIRIGVLGQEIGDRLLPMITPLIEKITDIVKRMSDWSKEHPKLTSALVKFAAVLGPLLIGLGALMMILPGLPALITAIGVAFHIATGPIGLIAMAIAGATAAFIYFYKTNEKFRGAIQKTGAYLEFFGRIIMEVFKTVGANIGNFLGWFSVEFPHVFRDVISAVVTIFKNLNENVGKAMSRFIEIIRHPIKAMKGELEKIDWTPLLEGFEATVTEIPKLIGINLEEAKEILKKKLTLIDAEFMKVTDTIDEMGNAIVDIGKRGGKALENLAESVEKVTGAYERGISIFKGYIDEVEKLTIVTAVLWHVMEGVGNAYARGTSIFKGFIDKVKELKTVIAELWHITEGVGNAYKRGISIFKGYIPEVEKLKTITAELWHLMEGIFKAYERGISTFIGTTKITKELRIASAELWHVMEGVGNAYVRGTSTFKGYIKEIKKGRTVVADFWHLTESMGVSIYVVWERLTSGIKELWEELNLSLKSGFASVVEDWLQRTITAKEVFEELGRVINESVTTAIANLIAQKLSEWVMGFAKALWERGIPALLSMISNLWKAIAATVAWIATKVIDFIVSLGKMISGTAIPALINLIAKIWAVVAATIAWIVIKIVNFITGAVVAIKVFMAATIAATAAIWAQVAALSVLIGLLAWLSYRHATPMAEKFTGALKKQLPIIDATIKKAKDLSDTLLGLASNRFAMAAVPAIPTAQVGIPYIPHTMPVIAHREEAILNPAQAREWRASQGEPGRVTRTYSWNVEIKTLIPPDDPVFWRNLVREHIKQALDEEEARRIV